MAEQLYRPCRACKGSGRVSLRSHRYTCRACHGSKFVEVPLSESEPLIGWAVVELMGHVKMAGQLSEEERFGQKMGRLDVPTEGEATGFVTRYFGGASVYRVTLCDEETARSVALRQPRPVGALERPRQDSYASAVERYLSKDDDDETTEDDEQFAAEVPADDDDDDDDPHGDAAREADADAEMTRHDD